MEDVGPLRPNELRVALDRRSAHYRDALALNVLTNVRRTLEHGNEIVWTWLRAGLYEVRPLQLPPEPHAQRS
jgi:hypothetical protein